MKYAIKINY